MTLTRRPFFLRPAFALVLLAAPAIALAQDRSNEPGRLESFGRDVSGAIGSIFGQGNSAQGYAQQPGYSQQRYPQDGSAQVAQIAPSEMLIRMDQLERQVRTLTGAIEQLQYRNQQLEQQIRALEDQGRGGPPAAAVRPGTPPARPGAIGAPPPAAVVPAQPPTAVAPSRGRRNDAFDPSQHPNAPGVPQPLGSPGSRSDALDLGGERTSGAVASAAPRGGDAIGTVIATDENPVGVPGGREPGTPLDLTRSQGGGVPSSVYPSPAQVATLPPAPQTPREEFDLAHGYVMRKDYARAEEGLRNFIKKHPSDRLTGDAQYWLGESMFQRQKYREAADAFVAMARKYESHGKAPDALLRLGQSLAALKEKELACATFGEVTRKYPRASSSVKQRVEREQKRAGC